MQPRNHSGTSFFKDTSLASPSPQGERKRHYSLLDWQPAFCQPVRPALGETGVRGKGWTELRAWRLTWERKFLSWIVFGTLPLPQSNPTTGFDKRAIGGFAFSPTLAAEPDELVWERFRASSASRWTLLFFCLREQLISEVIEYTDSEPWTHKALR